MLKKVFAYIISHTLFWLGDLISKPMNWCEVCAYIYPIYNRLMIWSSDIQDWAGNKTPWIKIEE